MSASLSCLSMSSVAIVPRTGTLHDHGGDRSPGHSLFCSSPCSCSCKGESSSICSSVPLSRERTPFYTKEGRLGSESQSDLAHCAIAPSIRHSPTPHRPTRNPTRHHKEVPTQKGLVSAEGVEAKPLLVIRRRQVAGQTTLVATRVSPLPHPPPSRPLPYPPVVHHPTQSPNIEIQTDTATVSPLMPLLPVLPVFLTRESSSSSSTSTSSSTFSPHNDTMLAVPILHPLAAHQGSLATKGHHQSNSSAQLTDASNKHKSHFIFPSAPGSTSPPPLSSSNLFFQAQHSSESTLNLSTSPRILVPHLPASAIQSPLQRPPQPYVTPSSTSLHTTSCTLPFQDSLSDGSMSTKTSIDSRDPSFRFRGPLGHPLWGLPVGAAFESRHPAPSVPTHPPSSFAMSMSGKRPKLRTSLSPLRAGLPEGDDLTDHEHRHMRSGAGVALLPRLRPTARIMSYSPANLSVLNVHGGLDISRRRHHPFRPDAVPYPRNYERTVIDLDSWDTLWLRQACKSVTFHQFKQGCEPKRVLDIGCGPGTWIFECAAVWKESTFVGLDIVPLQPDLTRLPGNLSKRITWIRANFLERLPFPNDEFDFVHIKRISRGVPEDMWDGLFEEITRIMKPGAALEIIEEDLTFPGRSIDADEESEVASSNSTIGCGGSGGAPSSSGSYSRSPRKRNVGQEQELRGLRGLDGLAGGGPVGSSKLNVLSSSSAPEITRTDEAGTFEPPALDPIRGVHRSRSLTHPPSGVNVYSPGTPPLGESKKRPSTSQSASPQKLNHAPGSNQSGMAMAAAAVLRLSSKRSHLRKERPSTANSASSPSLSGSLRPATPTSFTSASSPPSSFLNSSLSRYHTTASGSLPPTPPLSPPPKPKTDALSQAILMESAAPSYIMTPYPGAKTPAARCGCVKRDILPERTVGTNGATSTIGSGPEIGVERKVVVENPRDHTALEAIYNEMHAERFVNLTPLSLLGNALGLWFEGVRTHAPIVFRFPPSREELERGPTLLSTNDLMSGTSPYASFDDAQFTAAISPARMMNSDAPASPESATTLTAAFLKRQAERRLVWALPNGALEVDLRTLNVHLGLRVKEVLGCAEAMWDWVVDYQIKTKGGERDPRGVYALINQLSRADFDDLLAKFELDMEEHMTFGRVLEDQLGWFAIPDAPSQEKRTFGDKWRAYTSNVGSVSIPPSTRLNRTMRVFIAWKPS